MAILKLNNNSLTNVTELPSGVGSDPNTKVSLARLGLRVFANQNLATSNTQNLSYDVFQDSTGIQNLTNCSRTDDEKVSSVYSSVQAFTSDSDTGILLHFDNNATDSSSNNVAFSTEGSSGYTTSYKKFGTHSKVFDGSNDRLYNSSAQTIFNRGTGDFTIECWYFATSWVGGATLIRIDNGSSGSQQLLFGYAFSPSNGLQNYISSDGSNWVLNGQPQFTGASLDTWQHLALERYGNDFNFYLDGVKKDTDTTSSAISNQSYFRIGGDSHGYFPGYIDEIRYSTIARYQGSNFTPNSVQLTNATGSFEGVDVTAPSSVSKMGAVITYEETGTNVLNTDIVMKLSADSGSNFTTGTLEALPDFASGVKCAKISDLSVTPGTSCTYQINFANQSSGVKVAKITGVALTF